MERIKIDCRICKNNKKNGCSKYGDNPSVAIDECASRSFSDFVVKAYQCHMCKRCFVMEDSDRTYCESGYWPGCGQPDECREAFELKV